MNNPETALNQLKALLKEEKEGYTIHRITSALGNQSYAVILLLFSLPFAFPITIPGLSTPFGIALLLLSLRFTIKKPFWLPHVIAERQIQHKHLKKFVRILEKFLKKMRKIIKPRFPFLFKTSLITGALICVQSFFMALPVPLPLTNVFASVPVVLLGLGLLACDGLFILLGYLSSALAITFFIFLCWFGIEGFERLSPF